MDDHIMDSQNEDYGEIRPAFYIGQHDSTRTDTLNDLQYGQILNAGFSFVTSPITNEHFHQRVEKLLKASLLDAQNNERAGSIPVPVLPPLTIKDTTLFPGTYTSGLIAYSSPWIDLCSPNHVISSISRQVLNVEISYANFCGVRTIIVPGPRQDSIKIGNGQGVSQYARAIHEILSIGSRVSIMIHLPMYREPGLEEKVPLLGSTEGSDKEAGAGAEGESDQEEIDLFSSWDSWNTIRSICDYDPKLFVALRIPRVLPEKQLQTRWFSEPLQYLTLSAHVFQMNRSDAPALSRRHQDLIFTYMRLKNAPYFLLSDVCPELPTEAASVPDPSSTTDFPSLAQATANTAQGTTRNPNAKSHTTTNIYVSYLKHLEKKQEPFSDLEQNTLTNFQDWLQSPLQPLSDNLESVTYEVFEGDPVKYYQYEAAIAAALRDWAAQGKATSSPGGEVVIAVAGSGRGPLVTRALRASESTGVPVRVWAVEKNPNAYVYLLRQNQREWNGRVIVVKTDMRAWKGPLISSDPDHPVYGKVDILVSELLGSFGDNELSPECLDGIQHVLAPGHGISIPASYTAHVSPISTPRIHADIAQRFASADTAAFNTPWVVRLFAVDFVAERGVPDHPRFQQAWEFAHPLPASTLQAVEARRAGGVAGGGGGSMAGSVGANDHNARHCHLTFVCRSRGVVHGLAGYFEAVLYAPTARKNGEREEVAEEGEEYEDKEADEKVELSILPDMIDRKSKDMISWFPIFFPLKEPLYFPPDTELEVSMWRQTDDAKVWYEWIVEAYMWIGPSQRVKVGGSGLCSSRKMACLL